MQPIHLLAALPMLGQLRQMVQPSPAHFVVHGFSAGSCTGAVIALAIRCLWSQCQIVLYSVAGHKAEKPLRLPLRLLAPMRVFACFDCSICFSISKKTWRARPGHEKSSSSRLCAGSNRAALMIWVRPYNTSALPKPRASQGADLCILCTHGGSRAKKTRLRCHSRLHSCQGPGSCK